MVVYRFDNTKLKFKISEKMIQMDDCEAYAVWNFGLQGGFEIEVYRPYAQNLRTIIHELSEINIVLCAGLFSDEVEVAHEMLLLVDLG